MASPLTDLVRNKRVVVVGLGASGIAACRLLMRCGARVIGTDAKPDLSERSSLASEGISLTLGGHAEARLDEADLIVVSPGVPMFAELAEAEKKGVKIWGEVELAVQALAHPAPSVIAIGGTNGKSTTTSLIGAILERAGKRVFTGGNLGEPLAAHADEAFDVIVLEVSSFQMERVESFRPKVSVLLNVSPDHLDRYSGEQAYAHAKGNAFVRQTAEDFAVIPAGDQVCFAQARRGMGQVVTFGEHGEINVRLDSIVVAPHGNSSSTSHVVYERSRIALTGGHNALNVAAAIAAVRPFAIDPEIIRDVLASFQGLPHRMAFVRERGGVRFYDDSKGTNVGAVVTALKGVNEEKVVLIAGGRDKGGSYGPLVDVLRERGRAAILIGEAREAIKDAIGDAIPVHVVAEGMNEAVALAASVAQRGDAVLLSPACSSFDMFRDYKDRGDAFVRGVMALS